MTDTLYIIGNGFDLHHRLDTWYSSFGLYLKDNDYEIYEYFIKYFGLPELDEDDEESLKDPLWSQFESSLALLDIDEILSEYSDFAADPSSDDFSDGDWDAIAIYVSQIRDDLTIKMLDLFKNFILTVKYTPEEEIQKLNIKQDALFFNFNYTKSLEKYYSIDQDNILYIHNSIDSDEKLILGHGMDPIEFERKEEVPPEDLNEEEYYEWVEAQSDSFNYSLERGRDELIKYFSNSFKATSELIRINKPFFNSLKGINTVYVLGHSLGNVDAEYFRKIISSINNNEAKWYISYYNSNEIKEKKTKLLSYGLSERQIQILKINEI
ncbi:bacteriophage abortive infection AbiH family protein [Myroides odoratimimus]|uniref:bacteriophage abortive infection AbiH family protein n=1 Tax=Myroides odoratimimus TaxID=76832 RepID=UPI00370C0209